MTIVFEELLTIIKPNNKNLENRKLPQKARKTLPTKASSFFKSVSTFQGVDEIMRLL